MAIEDPVNKTVEKFDIRRLHNGKDNKSGVGSSTRSVATCHKCGKKYIRNCKSNISGSDGSLFVISTRKFQDGSPRSV